MLVDSRMPARTHTCKAARLREGTRREKSTGCPQDIRITLEEENINSIITDAEDKDFHVWDPVLLSQLQYSAEAADMEVIQLPGLVRVDVQGLHSVKECCQDVGLVHLQFGVQVNTMEMPHGGLQPAEGLTSFGDPLGNLVIDSCIA
ncbi:unnamed protein product [Schistocephalus solidus]|uniref:GABP-alpha domain-containing protein n=1 Tax=Schistocephalus solidus TaxID=70667 RepID=A0A183T1V4_SCHSO|nr:unnamed protein product [Schistocephalus solidus]